MSGALSRNLEGARNPDEQFSNTEIAFSVGRSVDLFDFGRIPAEAQAMRMLKASIVACMVEHTTLAVLAAHRDRLSAGTNRGIIGLADRKPGY